MARLPIPGQDEGTWGTVLNTFLSQVHNGDGTLKDNSVGPGQLQDDSVTATTIQNGTITEAQLDSAVQTKLNETSGVTSVNTRTGAVTLTQADVGLSNVDNTSDAAKPVSTATQTQLDGKVSKAGDTMSGDLSVTGNISVTGTVDSRDVSADGTKLDGIQAGAQVNAVTTVAGRTGDVVIAEGDVTNLTTDLAAKVPKSATYATDPATPRLKITNTYTRSVSSSNQMEIYSGATMTSWLNEWGAYRCQVPDDQKYDAGMRIIAANGQNGKLLEIQNNGRTQDLAYVDYDGTISSAAGVTAPNIGMPVKAVQSTQPDTISWQAGWLWYDTSTEA